MDWFIITLLEEAFDRCEDKQEEEDFKEHLVDNDSLESYVREELDNIVETWRSGKKNDSIQMFIDCALSDVYFCDMRIHMEAYVEENSKFY
jgi:hypothetical protein